MNTTTALRPLAALAASSLLLCTVVIAESANGADGQTRTSSVGPTLGCESGPTNDPASGINLGPLFQRAV